MRRGVYTSAYPLAEWVAEHWWQLRGHLRPSTVPRSSWTWRRVALQPWLRHHNLRAAGGGMPWPDLTLVPQGSVTRAVWTASDDDDDAVPVSYLTTGEAYLSSGEVTDALGRFVDLVVARLVERGIAGTTLQREWQLLADTDDDEVSFACAAARLGVDPYDVDDSLADDIVALADVLEPSLLAELLDSARPDGLRAAQAWIEQAREGAVLAARPPLHGPLVGLDARSPEGRPRSPWAVGYAAARAYRAQLELAPGQRLAVKDHVGTTTVGRPSGGLQGLVVAPDREHVGLVVPADGRWGPASLRFAQAGALGSSLLSDRAVVLLDPTATDFARTVRAFAAELLAPADGLRTYLSELPETTSEAFEVLARHYDVSPLLVRRQYENQVADTL